MFVLSSIRIFSALFVFVCGLSLTPLHFKEFFVALLFGHYFLSFFYAKHQVQALWQNKKTWLPLGILFLVSIFYIASGQYVVFLVPFIGFHVALSEVYMINRWNLKGEIEAANEIWHLNLSRFVINIGLYILLLNSYPLFQIFKYEVIIPTILLAFGYFVYSLLKIKPKMTGKALADYAGFEISGIAIAAICLAMQSKMSHQYFVFYHITTWVFFPLVEFRTDKKKLSIFSTQTILSTLFFVILAGWMRVNTSTSLVAAIPFWATIHFLTTFPLSRMNPGIIKRFFYPNV